MGWVCCGKLFNIRVFTFIECSGILVHMFDHELEGNNVLVFNGSRNLYWIEIINFNPHIWVLARLWIILFIYMIFEFSLSLFIVSISFPFSENTIWSQELLKGYQNLNQLATYAHLYQTSWILTVEELFSSWLLFSSFPLLSVVLVNFHYIFFLPLFTY